MKASTNDEVKGKVQDVKGVPKVMNDPTLEGKDENQVGRIRPKPENPSKTDGHLGRRL
jgi:hypothetical protein